MPKLIAIAEAAYEVDVAPNDVNRRELTDALDMLDVEFIPGPPGKQKIFDAAMAEMKNARHSKE